MALEGSLKTAAQNLHDLKAFAECVATRGPNGQTAEIPIPIALMNCFSVLGTVEIFRLA